MNMRYNMRGNKSRFLDTRTKAFKLHFYEVENGKNAVVIILSQEWHNNVIDIKKISDRLMAVKLVVGKLKWK